MTIKSGGITHGDRDAIFRICIRGFYAYNVRLLNDDVTAIKLSYWPGKEIFKLCTAASWPS